MLELKSNTQNNAELIEISKEDIDIKVYSKNIGNVGLKLIYSYSTFFFEDLLRVQEKNNFEKLEADINVLKIEVDTIDIILALNKWAVGSKENNLELVYKEN